MNYHLEVPTVVRPPAKVVTHLPSRYLPAVEQETATYAVAAASSSLMFGLVPVVGVIAIPIGTIAVGLSVLADRQDKRFAYTAMFIGLIGVALGIASAAVVIQTNSIL